MELLSEVKDEINYIGLLTDLIYGWKEWCGCGAENRPSGGTVEAA